MTSIVHSDTALITSIDAYGVERNLVLSTQTRRMLKAHHQNFIQVDIESISTWELIELQKRKVEILHHSAVDLNVFYNLQIPINNTFER